MRPPTPAVKAVEELLLECTGGERTPLVRILRELDGSAAEWIPIGSNPQTLVADAVEAGLRQGHGIASILAGVAAVHPGRRPEVERLLEEYALGALPAVPRPRAPAKRLRYSDEVEAADRLQPTLRVFAISEAHPRWLLFGLIVAASAGVVVAGSARRTPGLESLSCLPICQLLVAILMLADTTAGLTRDLTHRSHDTRADEGKSSSIEERLRRAVDHPEELEPDSWLQFAGPALRSVTQFRWGLFCLFLGWVVLYGTLTVSATVFPPSPQAVGPTPLGYLAAGAIANFGNNTATLGMFICYYVMTFNTAVAKPAGEHWAGLVRVGPAAGVALLIPSALDAWLIFSPHPDVARFYFDAVGGLAASLVMSLWIARFVSKIVDASPLGLIALYSYSAIQPFWLLAAGFTRFTGEVDGGVLVEALFITSLVLKCYLFIFVTWVVDSGRLAFYFAHLRRVDLLAFETWYNAIGTRPPPDFRETSARGTAWGGWFWGTAFVAVAISFGGNELADETGVSTSDVRRSLFSNLHGVWIGHIEWDVDEVVRSGRIPLCSSTDGGRVTAATSTGRIALTELDGATRGIGFWRFQTTIDHGSAQEESFNPPCVDAASVLVHVADVQESRVRRDSGLEYVVTLTTVFRALDHEYDNTTQPAGGMPTKGVSYTPTWRLRLRQDRDHLDTLDGGMFFTDEHGDEERLGTASLSRFSASDFAYPNPIPR